MQGGAFRCGDDKSGGAGAGGLGKLDLARGAQRLGDARDGLEGLGGCAALEIAAGNRNAQAVDAAIDRRQRRLGGPFGADGILRIGSLHGIVGESQISRRSCQRTQMIEAGDKGEGARAGKAAVRRLQAEQAAERGRDADRAVSIRAQRERHEPARNRATRAARGSACHMRGVMRVARGAVMDVLAGEVVGVLAHIERADEDGACRLQPRDQWRIGFGRWPVAIDLGAGQRRQARNIEQVLDGKRHAGEGAERLARGALRIDCPCFRERPLRGHRGEGVERGVALFDTGQRTPRSRLLHSSSRRQRRRQSRQQWPTGFMCQASNTGAGSASSGSSNSSTMAARRSSPEGWP